MDAKVISMIAELPRESIVSLLCGIGETPPADVSVLTIQCRLHDCYTHGQIDGGAIAVEWESLS